MRRNNTAKKVISIALTIALAFSNVSITYTKADDTSNVIEISDASSVGQKSARMLNIH